MSQPIPEAEMVAFNFSMSCRAAVSDALAYDDATPPSVDGARRYAGDVSSFADRSESNYAIFGADS